MYIRMAGRDSVYVCVWGGGDNGSFGRPRTDSAIGIGPFGVVTMDVNSGVPSVYALRSDSVLFILRSCVHSKTASMRCQAGGGAAGLYILGCDACFSAVL